MNWYFEDYFNNCDNRETWDYVKRGLSIIVNDPCDISINSIMKQLTATNKYIWASKFIEILASIIISKRNDEMSIKLKSVFINSFSSGNPIESLGHYNLTHSHANYMLRPLDSTDSPEYLKTNQLSMNFNLPIKLIREFNDIDSLSNGYYGLLTTNNSPMIDAVIQPNMLLQFKVPPYNHKGNSEKLNEIRHHLNEKDYSKHMIVFIIPYDNIYSFKYQHDLSDINQYITFDDHHSDAEITEPSGKKYKLSK
mmetsp:Transcript_9468/g.8470  ORF Transcript_9468/g.8470 Transcript_9468/m.8470 type:complete len:252 (+) Transcript_9468:140-895(+)